MKPLIRYKYVYIHTSSMFPGKEPFNIDISIDGTILIDKDYIPERYDEFQGADMKRFEEFKKLLYKDGYVCVSSQNWL